VIGLLRKNRFLYASKLKDSYDFVVIGGGAHGMATAYYLAKDFGAKRIAVLEKDYIGAGASGRNTTIIRANYRTAEGVRFYGESLRMYETLSQDVNFNMLFSQHGHLTLAHSDRSLQTMVERAEVNRLLGVDSRVVTPEEIAELCPQLDVSKEPTYPILGALYHPPGGIIRHDAVVWGYAKEALKAGVEIHPYTEVRGITRDNGRVTGVETSRGHIKTGTVISCVAGWSTLVCDLAGVELPITTHILQAFVTEPLKPLLDKIIVSGTLHVYVSQSDRGELLIGSEIEPYSGYSTKGTLRFVEDAARDMCELLPMLGEARVLRQWTGLCDVTPDYAPIMGLTEVEGFLVDAGWGTYGFKASPIVGLTMAELAATGRIPDLIEPFALERFYTGDLVSERGAAAVSH
jgi:sarcosine oxidase subunit beta